MTCLHILYTSSYKDGCKDGIKSMVRKMTFLDFPPRVNMYVRAHVCVCVCVFSFLSLSLRESCGCVFVLGFLKVVSGSGFGEKACEGSRDAGGMGAAVTTPLSLGPSPPVLPPQSRPPNLKALNIVCWGVGYEFGRQCHSTVDGG